MADFCQAKFAIGVASGTDALHLALRALDIGPGDEVITTPFSFIATAESISHVGAKPVFVDIDPHTFNIDAKQIEAKIGPRTRALLPVHLYGQPADMDLILAVADKHKLAVVEDCAQAIGATIGDRPVGSLGDIGCFSFFPSKNLGGAGDGGMAITSDEQLAARIKRLRAHGSSRKYFHVEIGFNSRLDEIQAAILRIKLRHLKRWTASRRSRAHLYEQILSEARGIETPALAPGRTHAWHQYTLRLNERDKIKEALFQKAIGTAIHYPIPIHLQPAYSHLGLGTGSYPQSERLAGEVLSIPIYPQLRDDQIEAVCDELRKLTK